MCGIGDGTARRRSEGDGISWVDVDEPDPDPEQDPSSGTVVASVLADPVIIKARMASEPTVVLPGAAPVISRRRDIEA